MRPSLAATVIAAVLTIATSIGNIGRAAEELDFDALRRDLVRQIAIHAWLVREELGIDLPSERVLESMGLVPRHAFVPDQLKEYSYLDRPLPVGHGQNIAQPYIVALMTDLADIDADDIVFETGTGAGYHAAILSNLAKRVYSVEVIEPLAERATETLNQLGYANVKVRAGDGYFGWAEHGPFDAIIVKEAVDHVPPPLLQQLKPGGRMVIPLGPSNGTQLLSLVTRDSNGKIKEKHILPVRFSPLQGGERI